MILIYSDEATFIESDASCFQIEVLNIWLTPDGPDNMLGCVAAAVFKIELELTIRQFFQLLRNLMGMKLESRVLHFLEQAVNQIAVKVAQWSILTNKKICFNS